MSMSDKAENDLRALLPTLLVVARDRNEAPQQTATRIIRLTKLCLESDAATAPVQDGEKP